MQQQQKVSTQPWWKFGYVWLIIAGPALVIVAGFITLYLAITSPNEMVTDERLNASSSNSSSMAPAVQGRNHAATGVVPAPK